MLIHFGTRRQVAGKNLRFKQNCSNDSDSCTFALLARLLAAS